MISLYEGGHGLPRVVIFHNFAWEIKRSNEEKRYYVAITKLMVIGDR